MVARGYIQELSKTLRGVNGSDHDLEIVCGLNATLSGWGI